MGDTRQQKNTERQADAEPRSDAGPVGSDPGTTKPADEDTPVNDAGHPIPDATGPGVKDAEKGGAKPTAELGD